MKNSHVIGVFLRYLAHHWGSISLLGVFAVIFTSIFSLYKLPLESILYSCAICFTVGLILLLINFYFYYKKHRLLQSLNRKISLGLEQPPPPHNLIESDYTALITTVHNEKTRIVSQYDNERTDMSDYYTMWAHQIKSPISAMQLILQEEDSIQNRQLSTELFKIEQYVEMVLSYVRLGSDSSDFVFANTQIAPIIKQAVRRYAPLFIRKKLTLNLGEVECQALTDEKWFLFVVEQILSNALKYTTSGSISIYIEAGKTLVIKDTGIGIASEDLPRLCQKGFTGYNGHKGHKASGLGLYLCKRILTLLGHSISIFSTVGCGTTVKINMDSVECTLE